MIYFQTNSHYIAVIFNLFVTIGITGLFEVLESLDYPFDEFGVDDIRLTDQKIEFKNDINYLFVDSDQFKRYEDQRKDDIEYSNKI